MTIVEKYRNYLRFEKNYSFHTEISYIKDIQQFESYLQFVLEEAELIAVDPDLIRSWVASLMQAKMSARTVNRKLSALKSFYCYAQKKGLIDKNPLRNIKGPKINKPIPSFVNHTDMRKVLDEGEVQDVTFETLRDRLILELFYVTGIRRAELLGLRDVDVDIYSSIILVTGKRNKQRIIPISRQAASLILAYQEARDREVTKQSDHLFVKEDGSEMYPMLIHRIVTQHLKWIPTLSKASPHVLRHSFATGMLNHGADINVVKELLGHSSLASTEIYTHTSFEELKNIYTKAHPRA